MNILTGILLLGAVVAIVYALYIIAVYGVAGKMDD